MASPMRTASATTAAISAAGAASCAFRPAARPSASPRPASTAPISQVLYPVHRCMIEYLGMRGARSVHRLRGAARRRCGAAGLSARLGDAPARDRRASRARARLTGGDDAPHFRSAARRRRAGGGVRAADPRIPGAAPLDRRRDRSRPRVRHHQEPHAPASADAGRRRLRHARRRDRALPLGRAADRLRPRGERELRADQCGASRDGDPARLARPRGGAVAARSRRHAGDRDDRRQIGVRDRRQAGLHARRRTRPRRASCCSPTAATPPWSARWRNRCRATPPIR